MLKRYVHLGFVEQKDDGSYHGKGNLKEWCKAEDVSVLEERLNQAINVIQGFINNRESITTVEQHHEVNLKLLMEMACNLIYWEKSWDTKI